MWCPITQTKFEGTILVCLIYCFYSVSGFKKCFNTEKIEKSTDTNDLPTMLVKTEAPDIKPTVRKVKRNARARKKAKKIEPLPDVKGIYDRRLILNIRILKYGILIIIDEEFEMDVFDYDNDDFENDPTFSLNCDEPQDTAKLFDEDYQQIISNTELIDLNITPRRKRKKVSIPEEKQYK